MKRVIALGALVVGGTLLVAPAAGAAPTGCPPGTTTDAYCTAGLTLQTNAVKATPGGVVKIVVRCTKNGPRCKGKLLLVTRSAGKASSSAPSSQGATVGSNSFSIAPGQSSSERIPLNRTGRRTLSRRGKLRVSVVVVAGGERTVLSSLLIRGRKHVTQVSGDPGFTG